MITLALSLSLSGRLAPIGRQVQDALRLFAADANAAGGVTVSGRREQFALRCHDDRSDPARCAGIYRELCASPNVQVILGPYSSELTAAAAPIVDAAGRLFISHSGASDELYDRGYRMIVGLQTPASQYLDEFLTLLPSVKLWRKRLAMILAPSSFTRALLRGSEELLRQDSARRAHVTLRVVSSERFDPIEGGDRMVKILRRNRINVLYSFGIFDHDVALVRAVRRSGIDLPILACGAACLSRFPADLGEDPEGIVGVSQWEPNFEATPELGPDAREFTHRMRTQTRSGECDFFGAQAYAAGVLVQAVIDNIRSCDQVRMRERFSELRTGTLFGAFAIDANTGRQIAHRMSLIQWRDGRKVTIAQGPFRNGRNSIDIQPYWRRLIDRAERAGRSDLVPHDRRDLIAGPAWCDERTFDRSRAIVLRP